MPTTDRGLNDQSHARALRGAGLLYVLLTVTSIFGFFAPQALVVPGDAPSTVHKIMAAETVFRLSISSSLVATIAFIFLVRELYRLLRDVGRSQASLMVILALLSIPLSFLTVLQEVAALTIINNGSSLSAYPEAQADALAMLFLEFGSNVSAVNSIFFGLWLLPFGVLVIRSSFIPRILGILLIVAGCSYLVGSLNFLLSPPFRNVIAVMATLGYLGELAIVAWLAIQAVKVQFGREQRLSATGR